MFKLQYQNQYFDGIDGFTVDDYYISKKFLWFYLPMKRLSETETAYFYNVRNIHDCLKFVKFGVIHWQSISSRPMWYLIAKNSNPKEIQSVTFETEEELKRLFPEELI